MQKKKFYLHYHIFSNIALSLALW